MTNNTPDEFEAKLSGFENPPEILKNGLDRYAVDETAPESVVKVSSVGDVIDVLKAASAARIPIVPYGGGTRIHIGNKTDRYTVALDLTTFDSIIDYDPEELIVVVAPGATIDQVNDLLAGQKQFLPLNPPLTQRATIGGTLASNSTGFLRDSYGTMRDLARGLQFVRADGTLVKAGGIVEKNVAGYDMTRLMIGSMGSLGVITQAAVRVRPLPEKRVTCCSGFSSIVSVADAVYKIINEHFSPSFLMILNRNSMMKCSGLTDYDPENNNVFIVAGIDGLEDTVEWQHYEIQRKCREGGCGNFFSFDEKNGNLVRQELTDATASGSFGVVCTVISTITGTYNLLKTACDPDGPMSGLDASVQSLFAAGRTHLMIPLSGEIDDAKRNHVIDVLNVTRKFIREHDGNLIIEKAPVRIKEKISVWPEISGMDMMKKLKMKFDPLNILNPGRLL